ncbi:MAG: hypothetical protein PF482_15690 [Desulfobacteraceae bacterium]|jgi:hypothetical protein|nr:hypothetical protein [Desulfobacteraceae bacterium]
MAIKENKIRCNLYLNKKNVNTVKRFIDGTGLNFTSYIDLFIEMVAKNIELFEQEYGGKIIKEENGEKKLDIWSAYEVLGLLSGGLTLTEQQVSSIRSGKIKIDTERIENVNALKKMIER